MITKQIIIAKKQVVTIETIATVYVVSTPDIEPQGLFLKLTKTYNPKGMSPNELYEATRREWKIKQQKVDQIEYIFATHNNTIIEVYKPNEWYANIKTGRLMFDGELAPLDVRQQYIGRYVPALAGVRNPVSYNF